jgi:hypothetical protein
LGRGLPESAHWRVHEAGVFGGPPERGRMGHGLPKGQATNQIQRMGIAQELKK